MIAFIDDHREAHGVERSAMLPIAPSTYRAHAARRRDPAKGSARARRDAVLRGKIRRVFDENFQVYGARKVWRQMNREGETVARCTIERLMRAMGLQGVMRGKSVRTTVSDKAAPCPLDKVNRRFQAPRPNALWVSDFTYVATWAGFVYVAFVIDTFARRIVGGAPRARRMPASCSTRSTGAVRTPSRSRRRPRASQPSRRAIRLDQIHGPPEGSWRRALVGSVGDSYDNALAETINGLYKAKVIWRRGPWRNFEAVEFATLEWVDWFNNKRLLEPIGNIPPAEAEARYYAQINEPAMAASFKRNGLRQTRGR